MRENLLWLNQRNFTFKNGALLAGVALDQAGAVQAGMGVDAGDVDNDGDEDLFVTNLGTQYNILYINDGKGLFEDRSIASGLGRANQANTGFGTGFFDYDNDGWLDVLVVNGAVFTKKALVAAKDPFPLHEINQLFRNTGNGKFEEVTARAGAVFRLSEVSRGALFGDLDNDGDTDVIVTNNNGPARLLLNNIGNRNQLGWIAARRRQAAARHARRAGRRLPRRRTATVAPRPHRRQLRVRQRSPRARGTWDGDDGEASASGLAQRAHRRVDGYRGQPVAHPHRGNGPRSTKAP